MRDGRLAGIRSVTPSHDRHLAHWPPTAPSGPGVVPPAAPDGGHLPAPGRARYLVHAARPEFPDGDPGHASARRPLRREVERVQAGVRRARGHRHRDRGAVIRGRVRVRGPAGARPEGVAGHVPARGLPRRPQAVRGARAPLSVPRRARAHPRHHSRLPGAPRQLRRGPEPRPAPGGRQRPARGGLRLEHVRPRARRRSAREDRLALPGRDPRPGRLPPPAADPLPLAVGHALLVRRAGRGRRRVLPVRRQEPALRPGGDPAGREGQLHRRPRRHRHHPGRHRVPSDRLPHRAGRGHRRRPPWPTTR